MSLTIQQKIIAPLAISFSMVTAACIMSGSPEPAEAKARAEVTEAAVPLSGELPSLAPMLKHAMPAVVNISVTMTQRVGATPFGPFMEDPMFRRFFGIPEQPQEREATSIGSGVIVDAKNGYVVTNNHVVAQADKISVRLNDDREFEAELVGNDPDTDIAILKIEPKNLTALKMADSPSARPLVFVTRSPAASSRACRARPASAKAVMKTSSRPMPRSTPATRVAHWSICAATWSACRQTSCRARAATSALASPFPPIW